MRRGEFESTNKREQHKEFLVLNCCLRMCYASSAESREVWQWQQCEALQIQLCTAEDAKMNFNLLAHGQS